MPILPGFQRHEFCQYSLRLSVKSELCFCRHRITMNWLQSAVNKDSRSYSVNIWSQSAFTYINLDFQLAAPNYNVFDHDWCQITSTNYSQELQSHIIIVLHWSHALSGTELHWYLLLLAFKSYSWCYRNQQVTVKLIEIGSQEHWH